MKTIKEGYHDIDEYREAVKVLEEIKEYYGEWKDFGPYGEDFYALTEKDKKAIDLAIEVLDKEIWNNVASYNKRATYQ